MTTGLLRILDANANRAREAIRVMEDVARFYLDNPLLQSGLKQLRHDLRDALGRTLDDAVLWRDTPGDVGTTTTSPGEIRRESVCDLCGSAGARLAESLRAIEESLKVLGPERARVVEQIRYRGYELDRRLRVATRPAGRFHAVRVCVLLSEAHCDRPWLETARLAIEGGADCLQLREKDLVAARLLERARALVGLCRQHKVISIINDRPDIALLAGADGVHLGQDDLPVGEARKLLGSDRIIGVSTHNMDQARRARLDGADYVGIGPAFASPTKPRDFIAGAEVCGAVSAGSGLPTLAIGGITPSNLRTLVSQGVSRIAVTACVTRAADPRRAVGELLAALPPLGRIDGGSDPM